MTRRELLRGLLSAPLAVVAGSVVGGSISVPAAAASTLSYGSVPYLTSKTQWFLSEEAERAFRVRMKSAGLQVW